MVCAHCSFPAMTLFEDSFGRNFAASSSSEHRLHAVANFSNLAEVLFAGRSRVPAAAIFFGLRKKNEQPDDLEMTTVFSPLVANQESHAPAFIGHPHRKHGASPSTAMKSGKFPYCEIADRKRIALETGDMGLGAGCFIARADEARNWPTLEDV